MALASPRFTARMIGVFYLVYVLLASLAGMARRGLIVSGNPSLTAANIMAHQSAYQTGFACDLLSVAAYIVVVVLLHDLLKVVNGTASRLAACFGFLGCVLMAAGGIFQLAPLSVLGTPAYAKVLSPEQLQVHAFILLRLYNQAYSIALVAFAFFDLLIGYLIFESTFLPRFVGVMMSLAGVMFLAFLVPGFGAKNLQWILMGAIGELVFILWLLVRGVDAERYSRLAGIQSSA